MVPTVRTRRGTGEGAKEAAAGPAASPQLLPGGEGPRSPQKARRRVFRSGPAARKPPPWGRGPARCRPRGGRGGCPPRVLCERQGQPWGGRSSPSPRPAGSSPRRRPRGGRKWPAGLPAVVPAGPAGGRTGRSGSRWAGSCFDSAVAPRAGSPALRCRAGGHLCAPGTCPRARCERRGPWYRAAAQVWRLTVSFLFSWEKKTSVSSASFAKREPKKM